MRSLHTVLKRASEPISYPLDFNPWLESIGSTGSTFNVGDISGITETFTVSNNVVTVLLTGGTEGTTYRIPVSAVAANSEVRNTVLEVVVLGIAPTGSSQPGGGANVQDSLIGNSTVDAPSVRAVNEALASLGGGGAIGDIDGGQADSTYGTTVIDGGGA